MRSLSLIRHAKSDWSSGAASDHERPLNERGRRDAPEMGRRLRDRGIAFDLMISSDACRALETSEAIRAELGEAAGSLAIEPRLYLVGPIGMLETIEAQAAEIRHLALVGHNPGMTELAQALGALLPNLPTCGIVTFDFSDLKDWSDIRQTRAQTIAVDLPKVKWKD